MSKLDITKEELQEMHKQISKARYFYYERSESIMLDYDYDMLEKRYNKGCNFYNVPSERRVTDFVGFSLYIPRQVFPQKD